MGGEQVDSPPPSSYTQSFQDHFPEYLSIGMTYDQYWNDDGDLPIYYRKANEIKMKAKNQELWLQGMYIYDALCKASPIFNSFAKAGTKPQPYPERPYGEISSEEQLEKIQKSNRDKAKASFMNFAERWKPK